MAEAFQFRLLTPTGVVFDGNVEEVSAVGPLGEFGVLAEHINFITSLVPGVLEAQLRGGATMHWIVSGGLAEVKDGVMTVLANSAEAPDNVDRSASNAEAQAAEQKFSTTSFFDPAYPSVNEALQLARARVEATNLKSATH